MALVFIRGFYPYPSGTAIPPSGIRLTSCAEQWARFEELLTECLAELGCEVVRQTAHPSMADDPRDAKLRIYAHKTKRDVAGDLFYKQMHLPELFTVDHLGWGADHSKMQARPDLLSIKQSEAERFVASLRMKFLETGASKSTQPERDESIWLPDEYIFAPTQTPRDYVQLHHAPIAILSFVHLIAEWANRSKQNVVFKLHPGLYHTSDCDNEIIDAVNHYAATSDYVFCLDANIHDLIARSRGVFTINSGVGFESLIHGKPVVTFGNCDYKWVTFNADREKNLDDAREFVMEYPERLRQEAERFIYYYCLCHAFNVDDEYMTDSRRRLMEYLAGEIDPVTLTVSSVLES